MNIKRIAGFIPGLLMLNLTAYGQNPALPAAAEIKNFREQIRLNKDILQLPGIAIAVVRDGKMIYSQVEGFADLETKEPLREDHMFQIASLTKTFTANLIMQYEQEGKISLEDYALNYRFINTYFGWPYNVDVNTRIRHYLSHTSEDGPGRSFVYNGQRFNFIYGAFEAAGGHAPFTDAYSLELESRIFKPLGMTSTIAGFPDTRSDTMFTHIATPYIYDTLKKIFVEDTMNYRWTQAFPATGILSNLGDMARYTTSYDRNELITASNYVRVTNPQILTDGSKSPYGIGWFTEEIGGKKVHWHYGHADAYAALLVRVPETGYTFILLSNSNAPSDALRLGSGNIRQSPFATAFLKSFIFPREKRTGINWGQPLVSIIRQINQTKPDTLGLLVEEVIGQALFRHYSEKLYKTHTGEAKQLLELLYRLNPHRFEKNDATLIYLLTDLGEESLAIPLNMLINSYEASGHIQPYVLSDIARYYERTGRADQAFRFYKKLADSKGFETWNETIESYRKTGYYLLKSGQPEAGRTYYWKAVNSLKIIGADDNAVMDLIRYFTAAGQQK